MIPARRILIGMVCGLFGLILAACSSLLSGPAPAVYILERARDSGWQQQATLKPAGWETPPGPGTVFTGIPAATDEAQGELDEAAYYTSVVFPGHFFSEEPEISFFGATVDLDENRLGATAGFASATYVFERRDGDWLYRFSIKPGREEGVGWEDFAQVVAISGDTLLLGTPGEFGDSAYVFNLGRDGAQ